MGDDDRPLGPAEMLDTLEQQQQRAVARITVDGGLLYLAWGLALAGGNLAMYAGLGPSSLEPAAWSAVVYLILLVGAGVVTAWHVRSRTAGLFGPELQRSTMWGLSWPIAFVAYWLLGAGLIRAGLDGVGAAHYFGIGAMLVVGVQYLGGGAVYRDWMQYTGGLVVLAGTAVAALVGLPAGYLVMAAVCGGGLLVLAALSRLGVFHGRA